MSRAGREPAEDVKRPLVAACQEVGLAVGNANMHLMKNHGVRLVHVGASDSTWEHDTPMLSVMASVGVDGSWPETVDIRCTASNDNALAGPWMKGRDRAAFDDLIAQLQATLEEREQIIAMEKAGRSGPYVFGAVVWDTFNPLGGLELS